MQLNKIIFQGELKSGTSFFIRYPTLFDAEEMWRYINKLSQERTFIRFQGEEISLEEEEKYLSALLDKISNHQATHLIAISEGQIIGIAGIDLLEKTERHVGVLGVSITKDFRRQGIGSKLMQLVIQEASECLSLLEIITLHVYSPNIIAKQLYEKLGFIEYGRLPNGVHLKTSYADDILMYKTVTKIN